MSVTRNISLSAETDARLRALPRDEAPSISRLIERVVVRELDRLDKARARKQVKA